MSKKLSIDPVTRIEGHLAINTEIENNVIVDARVAGRMYRGFEHLLVGRHPVDAARITQRICGICHEVHGIAASVALENLYGLEPTQNGLVLRDLILGLHLVTDHIFHFFQLTLPDYIDFSGLSAYRGKDLRVEQFGRILANSKSFQHGFTSDAPHDETLTVEMALGYVEAIKVRKEAGSGLASLGGKVPFSHAILPGGITTEITSGRLMNYANALNRTADFIRRFYLPQALQLAKYFPHYFNIGRSHGNFYSNGGFTLLDEPLYRAGISSDGKQKEPAHLSRIGDSVDSTFLDSKGRPRQDKKEAYSWVRGLRYNGLPMEVGPLARMVVNQDSEFMAMLHTFNQPSIGSSVMMRVLARVFEAQKICRYLLELLPQYRLDQPTINAPDMSARPTGTGRSMSLAARGPLNHLITSENGRVTGYQLHVPSTWNFGPTVNGVRGPVEEALVGTRIDSPKSADARASDVIEVGRIIRSFDPCMACSVH